MDHLIDLLQWGEPASGERADQGLGTAHATPGASRQDDAENLRVGRATCPHAAILGSEAWGQSGPDRRALFTSLDKLAGGLEQEAGACIVARPDFAEEGAEP